MFIGSAWQPGGDGHIGRRGDSPAPSWARIRRRAGARRSAVRLSRRFIRPDDPPPPGQAIPSGRDEAGGAGGRASAGARGADGRAPTAAAGADPGSGSRGRARGRQRGLAAAVPGPAAPAVARPRAGRRPGHPARLAPGLAHPGHRRHRRRARRLRPARVRVRAVPARARDRVLHGDRPLRRRVALDRGRHCRGGGHRRLPVRARP